MAQLVSLSGKVSQISPNDRELAQHYFSGEPAPDDRKLTFLVDNQPAAYRGHPVVGDGDLVTIAGLQSGGVVNALAIRNRSTGVDYGGASPLLYGLCIVSTIVGLFTLVFTGLGLVILAAAVYLGTRVRLSSRALSMVRGITSFTRSSPSRP
jgi:hypothetical protein